MAISDFLDGLIKPTVWRPGTRMSRGVAPMGDAAATAAGGRPKARKGRKRRKARRRETRATTASPWLRPWPVRYQAVRLRAQLPKADGPVRLLLELLCADDGLWWGQPEIRRALAPAGVKRESLHMVIDRAWRRGDLERIENADHDRRRLVGEQSEPRYLYRVTKKGRARRDLYRLLD